MLDLDKLLTEPAGVAELILGQTTVSLGGADYIVPARSMAGDEEWVTGLDGRLSGLLSALDKAGDDTTRILATLGAFSGELLDALVSYAPDAFPPVPELKKQARSAEVLVAVAKVWRLANPLAALAMAGVARQANGKPSGRTTTSRGRSNGRSRKSGGA